MTRQRRRLQERGPVPPSWYILDHVVGHGAELFVAAMRRGREGVVLKRMDSLYKRRSARRLSR